MNFFRLLQAVADKHEDLDAESKFLLERDLLEYKHAGHGLLSPSHLERSLQQKFEISNLERKFQQILPQDNSGIWLTEQELDGLPADDLGRWKEGTENSNLEKIFVPFVNGGANVVLTYAHSAEARKRMFLANNLRLKENYPLLDDIIRRRCTHAQFLGYQNHAAFRIKRRMAMSVEWVEDFLNKLRRSLVSRGRDEVSVLQERRLQDLREKGGADDHEDWLFPPWDKLY